MSKSSKLQPASNGTIPRLLVKSNNQVSSLNPSVDTAVHQKWIPTKTSKMEASMPGYCGMGIRWIPAPLGLSLMTILPGYG